MTTEKLKSQLIELLEYEILRSGSPSFGASAIKEEIALSDMMHRVGHGIGNQLTSIISLATILPRLFPSAALAPTLIKPEELGAIQTKISQYSTSILDEAWRVNNLNQRLVILLSARQGNTNDCDLERLAKRAADKLSRVGYNKEEIFITAEPPVSVKIDADLGQALIGELLLNAFENRSTDAKRNTVKIEISTASGNARLAVLNAIDKKLPENITGLFSPFITGHLTGRHAGLGLTVAAVLAERFSGTISLAEAKRGDELFACAEVVFPI